MKCPSCNNFELRDTAWLPTDGGEYRSDDHYDCPNCGPVDKDYVDALVARIADLESKLAAAEKLNQDMVRIAATKERPAYDEQQRRIMALEDRLAAAERDAKRWHWVILNCNRTFGKRVTITFPADFSWPTNLTWNEAIDAAISGTADSTEGDG